jgi:hypothetical protein
MSDGSEGPFLRLAELRRKGEDDGIISKWIGTGEARANLRVRAAYLAKIPRVEWDKKHFHRIKNGNGLSELKWKAEGKEFRAAGYDYKGYFVMVLGFTHKQKVYDPPGWLESAKKNMEDAKSGYWDLVQFEA